jgi:DNA-binding transcriptional ArsR family regulator
MRALPLDAKAVASLDKILHEPARLSVVACLAVVDEADFVFLQSQTGMTGGNLSSHVKTLHLSLAH